MNHIESTLLGKPTHIQPKIAKNSAWLRTSSEGVSDRETNQPRQIGSGAGLFEDFRAPKTRVGFPTWQCKLAKYITDMSFTLTCPFPEKSLQMILSPSEPLACSPNACKQV